MRSRGVGGDARGAGKLVFSRNAAPKVKDWENHPLTSLQLRDGDGQDC